MIEELPFTYLHVFTYSSRPGTPAAAMPNQVPLLIARERNQILRTLAAEKKTKFMQSFLGKRVEAITVNRFEQGATEALTDNYLQLQIQGRVEPNQWIAAEVEELVAGKLAGKLLPRNAAQGGSPPLAT
jgi:threonylcarbamoyladenosine tRNA methylthiotransferase MtaB